MAIDEQKAKIEEQPGNEEKNNELEVYDEDDFFFRSPRFRTVIEKEEVVRTKSFYLDPMDLEEAITRMEALGHDFFLYLDEEDERISVVYKRKDGGYGIIQSENKLA